MGRWKITVKKVAEPLPVVTEMEGDHALEDIRRDFGLEYNDVEWFTTEKVKS